MSVIVLAGFIGAGKSSYTKMLSERLGTQAFYEPVEDNPVLSDFYNNPERYAFLLQVFFLNKRFKAIKRALSDNNNVLDRSIYEDALFTYINHIQGNISEREMKIYIDLLNNMMEELDELPKKAPDLLIYLDGSFDTMLKHIKKRGRDYEQIEDDEELLNYYKLLYSKYQKWFEAYDKSPKMRISVDDFDIVESKEDEEKVFKLIKEKIDEINKNSGIGDQYLFA